MSQENSHYSSINNGAIVYVDGIGGYSSDTRRSSCYKPGGCGILYGISLYSLPVGKHVYGVERLGYSGHGEERGDISGYGGRGVFRYQLTSHPSFKK